MTIILNIGNTYSQAALWDGKNFEFLPRIETAELTLDSLPAKYPIVATTVVPETKTRLATDRISFIDAYNCGDLVDFSQVDASTLGADRVANAIALSYSGKLPAIALDCGTAVTLEIVDANRVFKGGAIAPGRALMRRALASGTAQLPEIPFSTELPEYAGKDTVETIRFGVDRGAVGMVRELLEVAAKPYGGIDRMHMVATGGDAPFFAAALPFLELASEEFTFCGIRLAAEANFFR
ncbi:MAG: type III pantothenate kinase [Victivallales bacterium]|nr:type III pantothenate kinase [Victivallales bacterium]